MLNPVPGARIPTSGLLSFQYKRSATHTHQGIDIGAPKGTPVKAVSSGTVEWAYSSLGPGFSGYGRVIVIRQGDDGPWFLYAHLDTVLVRPGQRVRKGQKIGTVGKTCFRRSDPRASCGGNHLHFEVSPRRYPQGAENPRTDPVGWLARGGEMPAGGGGGMLLLGAGLLGWVLWRG